MKLRNPPRFGAHTMYRLIQRVSGVPAPLPEPAPTNRHCEHGHCLTCGTLLYFGACMNCDVDPKEPNDPEDSPTSPDPAAEPPRTPAR